MHNDKIVLNNNELTDEDLQAFDTEALCPLHPNGHHICQDCSLYKWIFINQPLQQMISSLILSPSPELAEEEKQLAKWGEIPPKLKDAVRQRVLAAILVP